MPNASHSNSKVFRWVAPWLGFSVANAGAAESGQTRIDPTQLAVADLLQWSAGLLVVLAAIFACAWLLRKFSGFSSPVAGALKVLGGVSLGGREKVILLQAGKRQLLLGVAPGNVQTLLVLAENETITEGSAKSTAQRGRSFKQQLQGILNQGNHGKDE